MIYWGDSPHPAHQGFADAIGAEQRSADQLGCGPLQYTIPTEMASAIRLGSYDVIIAEGTRTLPTAVAVSVIHDTPVVYLAADQSIYELTTEGIEPDSYFEKFLKYYGQSTLSQILNISVDGIIAVSTFTRDVCYRVLSNEIPIRIAHPYIQPKVYHALESVSPSLDQNTAVVVGAGDPTKGVDLLIDAWPVVRKSVPDAELLIAGPDFPPEYGEAFGVDILGYVEDIPAVLSESSLCVQPSRADAFPVSVLEALCAGLPTIVTETTGNRSVVGEFGDQFVVPATPDALANSIVSYFERPHEEKVAISQQARDLGEAFDAATRKSAFAKEFIKLLHDIDVVNEQ